MLRLLGRANSSNVMKIIWLLAELELPYEREDAGLQFGVNNTPDYLRMNPTGLVPTLIDDGFVLWESNAILRYVCGAHAPDSPLWPQDHRARASIDRWMDWQQTTLNRPQGVVFQGLVRIAPEKRDNMAIERALEEVSRAWITMDNQLAMDAYVSGEHLSLADIAIGVHVHRWFSFPIARPDTPHLRAWYDQLLARPAYRKHCAAPMT